MANPHNRKPIYFRSTNPGLGNVDEIASRIFQFDETGNKPAEVLTGAAVMPPQEALNEILVWSDSNTLGYTGIPNAPMFWGDGGVGGEKILQMINHVAGRKSGLQFYEIEPATDWILDQNDIYTNLAPISIPGSGIPTGTVNVTVEVRSEQKISLQSFYFNQGKSNAVLYGTHGDSALNNPVAWLPTSGNFSQTINNVAIGDNGYTGWQLNIAYSHNGYIGTGKWFTYYVNGELVSYPTGTGFMYSTGSIASSFRRDPAGSYLQNGDDIVLIVRDVPGIAPLVETSGSGSTWDNTLTFEEYNPDWNFADPNAMNFSTDLWANTAYPSAPYSLTVYVSRIAATAAMANLAVGDIVRIEQSSGDYYEAEIWTIEQNQVGNGANAIQPTYRLVLRNPVSLSGIWNASLPTVLKFNN